MQQSIHEHTSMCWDKASQISPAEFWGPKTDLQRPSQQCMAGSSIGARFSSSEGRCLENCTDAFLNTSTFIVKHIQSKQGGH